MDQNGEEDVIKSWLTMQFIVMLKMDGAVQPPIIRTHKKGMSMIGNQNHAKVQHK